MSCHLEILGSCGLDHPPSFLFFFENVRFIVQAPEGFQRLCTEHRVKLARIQHILLTRLAVNTFGGLPGLCITLADMGVRRLNVHGPRGLQALTEAVKSFSVRTSMDTVVRELADTHTDTDTDSSIAWSDEQVTIRAIKLGQLSRTIRHTHTRTHSPQTATVSVSVERPEKRRKSQPLPSTKYHCEDDEAIANDDSDDSTMTDTHAHSYTITTSATVTTHYSVFSYVFELAAAPGKFDANKAKALGMKPGPLFAKLKSGESVEAEVNGGVTRLVAPSECVGPPRPGPVAAIIDIPVTDSEAHQWIETLVTHRQFTQYHRNGDSGGRAMRIMVHLGAMAVITDTRYVSWMRAFSDDTKHVLVNFTLSAPTTIFNKSQRYTELIAQIEPQAFALWSPSQPPSLSQSKLASAGLSDVAIIGNTLDRFALWPHAVPPTSDDTADDDDEPVLDPQMIEALKSSRQAMMDNDTDGSQSQAIDGHTDDVSVIGNGDDSEDESFLLKPALPVTNFDARPNILTALAALPSTVTPPSFLFLGTGSAIPSKYRNVTGIHFDDGCGGLALIDCGEGTFGQCCRAWGVDAAVPKIASLRLVFISHMHADHHLGLPAVSALWIQREQRRRESHPLSPPRRLLVVGPRKLQAWLVAAFQNLCDIQLVEPTDAEPVSIHSGNAHQLPRVEEWSEFVDFHCSHETLDFVDALPATATTATSDSDTNNDRAAPCVWRVRCVPVRHCPDAYGMVLQCTSFGLPLKLVYSGDTLPCQSLIDEGADATVLIHEATFESGMEAEAFAKRHSTIRQAVRVRELMRAHCLLLTHFSQRYPKIPEFPPNVAAVSAFDLMNVALSKVRRVTTLTDTFAKLLERDADARNK